MSYLILFEKTETGYSAYAPDLPGCIAAGSTFDETAELMRGAVEMHLEGLRKDGDPIPEPTTVGDYAEVAGTQYAIVIEKASGSNYSSYAPDVPGCISAGKTIEEVKRLMTEGLEFHFEGMREDGDPIPGPTTKIGSVEV